MKKRAKTKAFEKLRKEILERNKKEYIEQNRMNKPKLRPRKIKSSNNDWKDLLRLGDESRLEKRRVLGKGWGVFPKPKLFHVIKKGEYVCEYIGERLTIEEGRAREAELKAKGDIRCYLFEVQHKNKKMYFDATTDDGRMGRLINHSKLNPNLERTAKEVDGSDDIHLVFFAKKDIYPHNELLYDYGDKSRESLKHHPWLAT